MPLDSAHRSDWGRLLALLTRQLGSLDLAEDALQDAFILAVEAWRSDFPDQLAAWLLTAARRRAIDRLRRERVLRAKLPLLPDSPAEVAGPEQEEESMSKIPTCGCGCCSPAATLAGPRGAGGADVALRRRAEYGGDRASFPGGRADHGGADHESQEEDRGRRRSRTEGPPTRSYRIASTACWLYLVFNESYAASRGDAPTRRELCEEAIRPARVLAGLAPNEPESLSLLALMLMQHSRREARFDATGHIVLLPDQDRGLWDRAAVAEGLSLLQRAAGYGRPGVYQLQAAIATEHSMKGTQPTPTGRSSRGCTPNSSRSPARPSFG